MDGTGSARTVEGRRPDRRSAFWRWIERTLLRVDRLAAWLSAALLFLYFVTGFALNKPAFVSSMTGGLLSYRLARDIHYNLHVPLIVAFTFHTIIGLRRALHRKTRRSRLAAWIAIGIGVIVLGYLLALGLYGNGI